MKNKGVLNSIYVFLVILATQVSCFAQDKPHVVFLAGEEEYGSHWTLPKIAHDLETRFNIRTTVIHSWRSGVDDYNLPGKIVIPEYDEIKNLEIIKEADLLVMHIRFRIPPPEQYALLKQYFDSGKPAIAFRTTSHAFWPEDQKDWFVTFFGGHYKGHMPSSEGTTTMVPAEQLDHPVLRGVPKKNWMNDIMGIYVTAPLNETTTVLMMGKTGLEAPAQPVTWINEYSKNQKILYTSLGGLESFIDPGFLNMVYNAVFWALDREIPENGVLGLKDLSAYKQNPPFEPYSFGELNPNPYKRPEEELRLENAKILEAEFQTSGIPTPPQRLAPANAIVLFNGSDMSKWQHWDLSAEPIAMLPDARAVTPSPKFKKARWEVKDGAMEARPGYGSILTKKSFGNYRLHLDFLIPDEPDYIPARYKGSGGIFLDGRYEIKLLDSYGKQPTAISNGSVFRQVAPISNPSKPVNTWQSLDIEFRQDLGNRPQITVFLNGTRIHDKVKILSRSDFAIREDEPLFISTEEEGSVIYNMNDDDWAAHIEFRSLTGGELLTYAPKDRPWNEASKGLLLQSGKLVYKQGPDYHLIQDSLAMPLNDGKWHKVLISVKDGILTAHVNGQESKKLKSHKIKSASGLVLRVGQGANVFRLGASELQIPFKGEVFDGEIRKVQFIKHSLRPEDIQALNSGNRLTKSAIALDWPEENSKQIKKGPIRIQSDLSKIRYANIWLTALEDEK